MESQTPSITPRFSEDIFIDILDWFDNNQKKTQLPDGSTAEIITIDKFQKFLALKKLLLFYLFIFVHTM